MFTKHSPRGCTSSREQQLALWVVLYKIMLSHVTVWKLLHRLMNDIATHSYCTLSWMKVIYLKRVCSPGNSTATFHLPPSSVATSCGTRVGLRMSLSTRVRKSETANRVVQQRSLYSLKGSFCSCTRLDSKLYSMVLAWQVAVLNTLLLSPAYSPKATQHPQ